MPNFSSTIEPCDTLTIDVSAVWFSIMESLRAKFGDTIFQNWIQHMSYHTIDDAGRVSLTAPTRFVREWIVMNYEKEMLSVVQQHIPAANSINIVVKQSEVEILQSENANNLSDNPEGGRAAAERIEADKFDIDISLKPHMMFENFVIGDANRMAYECAMSFASNSGKAVELSNVLYVYSSVGMGKTHLLQAVGHYVKSHLPEKSVIYLTAERFMHYYIRAVRSNEIIAFREQFRLADLVLLDDLQFICGRVGTEQEFYNTLYSITESNKKIVLSADRSPYDLELDERSKSRLSRGIIARIRQLEPELRIKILNAQSKLYNLKIDEEVSNFISANITSSVRDLESAICQLVTHNSFYSHMTEGDTITLDNAKAVLDMAIVANEQKTVSIDKITELVASFYEVTVKDVKSKKRGSKLASVRQIISILAKEYTDLSFVDIGKALGNRRHTAIIYYINKSEGMMRENPTFASDVAKLKRTLGA